LNPGIVPTDYYTHEGGLSLADLRVACEVIAQGEVIGIEIAEFQNSWSSNGMPVSPAPRFGDGRLRGFGLAKNCSKHSSTPTHRQAGQAKPLGRSWRRPQARLQDSPTGGVKVAVLGRDAMNALEKIASSTAWGTVLGVMKDRLVNALASGDTTAALCAAALAPRRLVRSTMAD
jgi:hypothetical protein